MIVEVSLLSLALPARSCSRCQTDETEHAADMTRWQSRPSSAPAEALRDRAARHRHGP